MDERNNVNNDDRNIEIILNEIGGSFGKYQIYNYLLLSYAMFVCGQFSMDYVFSSLSIDHRCKIDGCDSSENIIFESNWLPFAVPYKNGKIDSCHRYERANIHFECDISSFNRSIIQRCPSDQIIYRTDEISIMNEFGLECENDAWKLAMVGTINNIGRLITLPFIGILSDRFGRKCVMVNTAIIGTIFKLIKSFTINYESFILLELFDAGFAAAVYPTTLILAMELSMANDRILVSCLVLASYPLGQASTALIASYAHNFRWMLRIMCLFGFSMITFYWLASESLRWLLVRKNFKRSTKTIEKALKINGIETSTIAYELITKTCHNQINIQQNQPTEPIKLVLGNCLLLSRLIICTICWISGTFVTYGLSIISVSIPGDKYFNFMIVSFGAFIGTIMTYILLTYVSRRISISATLIITGCAVIAAKYFETNMILSLGLFFIGKCLIHHSFTSLYVFTIEMWPTSLRSSIMGICSMVARIGSITAPLTPLLINIAEYLPFAMYSSAAFVSGLLILCLPETFRLLKLPDTVADIKKIP